MNVAGIICEYNPFHKGHERHIRLTRTALGPDTAIVCIMSGNYTQRGEPAVFEKHVRAEAAIRCGADLVVELPFCRSVASAGLFADGAVAVLHALGLCTHISFGSECGQIQPLLLAAQALSDRRTDHLIREQLQQAVPYAQARQRALTSLIGDDADVLRSPNNALAVEYLISLKRHGSVMQPITIRREGTEHDAPGCSAKSIRAHMLEGASYTEYLPLEVQQLYSDQMEKGRGPVGLASLETAILSAIRRQRDFSRFPGASEGLGDRLRKVSEKAPSVEQLIEQTKSKRYARSRVSRLVLCAYLGITQEDVAASPSFARVLALNQRGKALLHQAHEKSTLPLITKPASVKKLSPEIQRTFLLQAAATDLYVLGYSDIPSRAGGQEWTAGPVLLDR